MQYKSVLFIGRPGCAVPAFHSGHNDIPHHTNGVLLTARESARKTMENWVEFYAGQGYNVQWMPGNTKVVATKYHAGFIPLKEFDRVELFIS